MRRDDGICGMNGIRLTRCPRVSACGSPGSATPAACRNSAQGFLTPPPSRSCHVPVWGQEARALRIPACDMFSPIHLIPFIPQIPLSRLPLSVCPSAPVEPSARVRGRPKFASPDSHPPQNLAQYWTRR